MKTIKIIDLLNKIANGEEVPKKIKYEYETYELTNTLHNYFGYNNDMDLLSVISGDELNDLVEILDVEDEFEDIEEIDTSGWTMSDTFNMHEETINQLIKNQKKIIERLTNEN